MPTIGIIGYKNHALRLMKLADISYVYHPSKKEPFITNNFEDLLACDAVIIASPTETHFSYLSKLKDFKGYIFCEKPPVSTLTELEKLSKFPKGKIYFNFNHRFGFNLKNPLLGKLQHLNITVTHGLAFKNPDRVKFGTVLIHYVDLLMFNFGKIESYFYHQDHLSLKFKDLTASIFTSYSAPYINEILVIGTDGFMKTENGHAKVYYPRDTFDEHGFFITPPVAEEEVITHEETLKRSWDFFMKHVSNNKKFEPALFEAGLAANKFILDLADQFQK